MHDHKAIHRHFKRADPVIAAVIKQVGPFILKPQRDRFKLLVRSILSQQVSMAAAKAIWARLDQAVEPEGLKPGVIARFTPEKLRECGISRQKAGYLLDLSQKCQTGAVQLSRLGRMSDERVIEQLVQVKGIGRWSAQMFLIFALGRPDVFPYDDFGLRSALFRLYGLKELPKRDACLVIGERWRPYSSIATWYCWRYLELGKKEKKP